MVYTSQQEECVDSQADATEHSVSRKKAPLAVTLIVIELVSLSPPPCREQENNLERKYELLNRELRAALSVEDWRKSEAQREREGLLLAELVAIVDKRNELVQSLHSQEQA